MRIAVFVICGLETIAAVFFLWLGFKGLNSSEALGRSISQALLIAYGAPLVVAVIPAFVLAALNRWVPFALGLCTLGVLVVLGLLRAFL